MKKIFIIIWIICLFCSCDDFLDIVPVGKLIPKKVKDYELMFNDDNTLKLLNMETFYGSPDFCMSDASFRASSYFSRACYAWAKQVYDENSVSQSDWGNLYAEIYINNTILSQINMAEGDDLLRKNVIAEARARRAFSYLLLIGIYARQYDEVTAAEDLGVPLRLDSDVTGRAPARATVKEVYDFILKELTESITDLPDVAKNRFRYDKAVAYSMLARTYWMMRKYDDAMKYADLALGVKHELRNFNEENPDDYPLKFEQNPEFYLFRYFQTTYWGLNGVNVSEEFYNLFPKDNTDNRAKFWIRDKNEVLDSVWFLPSTMMTVAPTVPEMYLIRAEAYARKGDAASLKSAMSDVNIIRQHRLVKRGYQDISVNTQKVLIDIILQERRKDINLMGGLGWFDLKRLNKESGYARVLSRTVNGHTYTLEPNSNNYVLPVPYDVLRLNSAIKDNPRN